MKADISEKRRAPLESARIFLREEEVRYRERGEERRENGRGMEGFLRAAPSEFSEISGSRSEREARALGLDDYRSGKEDAHDEEGVSTKLAIWRGKNVS